MILNVNNVQWRDANKMFVCLEITISLRAWFVDSKLHQAVQIYNSFTFAYIFFFWQFFITRQYSILTIFF